MFNFRQDGSTALFGASLDGNVEVVQELINAGANVDIQGKVMPSRIN